MRALTADAEGLGEALELHRRLLAAVPTPVEELRDNALFLLGFSHGQHPPRRSV